MGRFRLPWGVVGLLFVGAALGGWPGFLLAALVSFVGYLFSVRHNPRVICYRCDGEGRYRGWFWTWAWHWCHHCGGNGRRIRWGAAQWGTPAAQTEAARNRAAAAARPRRR